MARGRSRRASRASVTSGVTNSTPMKIQNASATMPSTMVSWAIAAMAASRPPGSGEAPPPASAAAPVTMRNTSTMKASAVCTRAKTSVPSMLSPANTTTRPTAQVNGGRPSGSACETIWSTRINSAGSPKMAGVM